MLSAFARRLAMLLAALPAVGALAACVAEPAPEPTPAPAPPPLAQNRERPALALIEHVLGEHFAGAGAGADPPTTCVELSPAGLSAEEEQALIARFPRLAPRERCETQDPPPEDGITGERAVVIQVYGLECSDPAQCTGWAARPGSPAMRYTMRFEEGTWRFEGSRRLLAE